ncbi:MAG: hypothetical protein U5L46_16500 [Agrobacterium sp.]|nr:hypothetical protein [Agrobacterium sp.]
MTTDFLAKGGLRLDNRLFKMLDFGAASAFLGKPVDLILSLEEGLKFPGRSGVKPRRHAERQEAVSLAQLRQQIERESAGCVVNLANA